MKQRRLSQRRQRFMKALHHQIRSLTNRAFREKRAETEMCAVSRIHNQGNPGPVHDICNLFNIGNHSVISRGCNDNRRYVRHVLQSLFHLFRPDRIRYPIFPHSPGIQEHRMQFPQETGMIY